MFDTGILDNEQDMTEKEVDMAEKDVSTANPVTTAGEVVTNANVVVSTAKVTSNSTTTTTVDELTLAQTLIEIKVVKPKALTTAATTTTTDVTRPKAIGVVVQEPSEFTTTTSPSQPSQLPRAKDKGKAKMVEPEKPLKKKDQIMFDKKVARKLQAQLDAKLEEEEKLAIQREEDANIAKWDGVQAMMDANYELAARLQAVEQRELTIKEKSRLFMELMNKRKKHFARLRAEKQRRKPPTKAQKRNTIHDKEEAEMKKHMEIVPNDEVVIDAIPLATKPPIIVEWKIIKERKMGYFQIIRADGSSKRYSSMIKMFQNIDREYLETLWKLVKAKHGSSRPDGL
ncbi:hypothetical protein Tco_1163067 [Tanacetum coccineum]